MRADADRLRVGQRARATHRYPERSVFCRAVTWVWEGVVEEVRPGRSGGWAVGWIPTQVVLRDAVERTEPEEPRLTRRADRLTLGGFDTGTTIEVLP